MSALMTKLATMYQRSVGNSLAKYGLRYDDILVESEELYKATKFLPKEEYVARGRRHTRAADIGLKRSYLAEDIQAIQEPMNHYLHDNLEKIRDLADERTRLTRWS